MITDWLKNNGYLQEADDDKIGKKVTLTTEKGRAAGITHSLQINLNGASYYRVEYDRPAQEFITANLSRILGGDNIQA